MKTFVIQSIKLLLISVILMGTVPALASGDGDNGGYFIVNGVVKNKDNNRRIGYANVAVKGTNIGTVTNENGEFTLKVKNSLQDRLLVISHVGYVSSQIHMTGQEMNNVVITLTPQNILLNEIIVRGDPENIVLDAIRSIKLNYENKNCLLTGFYRETARKRQHYINISEAVVDVYKTDYKDRTTLADRVQILKGRKLLSEKRGDTLAVRLLGGPNLSVFMDIVKNPDVVLDENELMYYQFKMEEPVFIDKRLQYVISLTPRVELPYALYYGKLYIDSETLAFTRAELSLDMRDKNKATQAILKKKPFGLVFKPQELTFLVDYKEREGKMCMNYVKNELKFKCDWKKKLFSTSYTIVAEMVTTDMESNNVKNIPHREAFDMKDSFTDKVEAFIDEDFWGAYNIIAPTESLEKAVNKLKKQYK
jgi:hypothetical protein